MSHVTYIEGPDSSGQWSWSCSNPDCGEDASGYDDPDEVIDAAEEHGPLAADSPRPSWEDLDD